VLASMTSMCAMESSSEMSLCERALDTGLMHKPRPTLSGTLKTDPSIVNQLKPLKGFTRKAFSQEMRLLARNKCMKEEIKLIVAQKRRHIVKICRRKQTCISPAKTYLQCGKRSCVDGCHGKDVLLLLKKGN